MVRDIIDQQDREIKRLRLRLAEAERELDEQIALGTTLARLLEADRARLAEAEALVRKYRLANDERGPMFWRGLNQRADAFLAADSATNRENEK